MTNTNKTMISKKELLINILYNLFGWCPIHQTRYKKNKEISKTRRDILYNNLEYCHSPLSMNELEWCYKNESEIQRDYLSLANYHQDKFSHKRMDVVMGCLLLSLLTCLVVACYTEFAYFFFYMGLMGLILYIYGYKLWNKIQGANLLNHSIAQIEEHRKTKAEPEPLEHPTCIILDAFISLEGKVSGAFKGIQKRVDFQTKTIQETITEFQNQIELQTITHEEIDLISETNPLDSILTCLNFLSSNELLDIKDNSILNHEFNNQYIFTIPQSQLTFLLALLVRNNKITLAFRKQTEIARFIAEKFYYEEIDSIESKYKDINNDAFAKELNKFSKMDATTFKDKYHAYKPDLRYFYEVYIIIEKGSTFYLKSIPFGKDFQRT